MALCVSLELALSTQGCNRELQASAKGKRERERGHPHGLSEWQAPLPIKNQPEGF